MITSPSFSYFFSPRQEHDPDRDVSEKLFFQSLRMHNGSFKTTYANRFKDLDQLVLKYIHTFDQPVQLMDAAVSSGITTLEWCKLLDAANISYQMVAGDLIVEGKVISWNSWIKVLTDDSDYPLQFEVHKLGIRGWLQRREILYLLFIPWVVLRLIAKGIIRIARSGGWMSQVFGISSTRVWLVTPKLKDHPAVEVRKDDIFVADPDLINKFHCIRVANILNRVYFSSEDLTKALKVIKIRLQNGGLLIVCRTSEKEENNGSIFRLVGNSFLLVERIGDGSEIEDIVLGKQEKG